MPDNAGRDPDEVATTLARWLAARLPAGAEPVVTHVQAPESNGFSNETILCRASWQDTDGPVDQRLVVRVAPTRNVLFLDADFSIQYRVMAALADGRVGLPLPKLGWFEDDPSWLGVPFFTMDHVDGLVPPDNLPYTMEGWVVDAAPAGRSRTCSSAPTSCSPQRPLPSHRFPSTGHWRFSPPGSPPVSSRPSSPPSFSPNASARGMAFG